jgi:hypothetical protein
VSTSAEYLAPPPAHARAFADGQDFVVADPMHPRWPDVARDVVAKTFDEQLWSGAKPATQITQAIKAQADPLLKQ